MKICLKLIIANKKNLTELGSKVHNFVATAKPDFLHENFCITFFHEFFYNNIEIYKHLYSTISNANDFFVFLSHRKYSNQIVFYHCLFWNEL